MTLDAVGVGAGPFNLSLAALLAPAGFNARFFERTADLDSVLGSLRTAGFSTDMAAHAYSILDGYIYGFTLTELTLPFSNSQGAAGVAEIAGNILDGFRPDEYPHLAEMAVDHAMKPGYNYGDEFEFGLDLILDGIMRVNSEVRPVDP